MGSLIKARKGNRAASLRPLGSDSSEAQLTSEYQSSGGREAPHGQSHQSQKRQPCNLNATPWRDSSEAQLTSEDQSSGGWEAPHGQFIKARKGNRATSMRPPGVIAQKPS